MQISMQSSEYAFFIMINNKDLLRLIHYFGLCRIAKQKFVNFLKNSSFLSEPGMKIFFINNIFCMIDIHRLDMFEIPLVDIEYLKKMLEISI